MLSRAICSNDTLMILKGANIYNAENKMRRHWGDIHTISVQFC